MTHVYLIRHGDSIEDLKDGKYQDLGLSPEGIKQSERLRDRLTKTRELKPDVFIASTMRRAQETAKILEPAMGQPIISDEGFEEWRCDDGTLDPDEFMRRWNEVPKAQKAYYHWMEGYENRLEFVLRVHLSMNRVIQTHAGKTIVIVSHGAFIQSTFLYFFGYGEAGLDRATPEIRRTSITCWYQTQDTDRWTLERSNDYAHLRD
jgi:probable phosphoglycerate mutase